MDEWRLQDRLWHVAYRSAFAVMRLRWWITHPDHHGALVALWHDGRVLIVRQSYRRTWTFPGGGIKRGEAPAVAAARELREEIGVILRPEDLTLAHDSTFEWEFRRDRVTIFEHRFSVAPAITVDRREILSARFESPGDVLRAPLSPHVRSYLAALAA